MKIVLNTIVPIFYFQIMRGVYIFVDQIHEIVFKLIFFLINVRCIENNKENMMTKF